jgi:hypothetical protein
MMMSEHTFKKKIPSLEEFDFEHFLDIDYE